jgi:hypothetical protein
MASINNYPMNYHYFNGESLPRGFVRVAPVISGLGRLMYAPEIIGKYSVEDRLMQDQRYPDDPTRLVGIDQTLTSSDTANARIIDWAQRKGFRLEKID